MTVVLAIDQGTSGTKAVVVDEDGQLRGLAELSIRPSYLPNGGVEQNPQEMLDSVITAGQLALEKAGCKADIVTLANQGETVLAWNPKTGEPLSQMLVWQDRRAESICAELSEYSDDFAHRTGLVLDPYFSAPKQAWIRRNVTTEGVVTTSDSWLLHKLTGEFVTDVTTASRSLILDLETANWDAELVARFGLQNEALPTIVANDQVIGSTSVFTGEIAVGGLVVDQQAALLAESCLLPGEAKCTFGTGAFLLANASSQATRSSTGLSTSVAWQVRADTTYCFDGQVYTAASAVRWLQKLGFINGAHELDAVAAEDSKGVYSVPSFAGLAAPWWKPEAKASITGMTLSTEKSHIVKAVLQGIAAQVAELGLAIGNDIGYPLQRLRVDGGLTQSAVLMQAVADLMQIEIDIFPSQHATPLGAVALARLSMNPNMSLADSVVAWQPVKTYSPSWSATRSAEFLGNWKLAMDASN